MSDADQHFGFWRKGAQEEWDLAEELLAKGRTRHGLFFLHLALEKSLKALIWRATSDIPPRSHNLPRLAELTGLEMGEEHIEILAEMTRFNLSARYPEEDIHLPSPEAAEVYRHRAWKVFQWLMEQ